MTAGSRRVTRGKQYYLHIVLFGSSGMVFVYAQDCWLGRTLGGTHTVTSSLVSASHYLSPVSVDSR